MRCRINSQKYSKLLRQSLEVSELTFPNRQYTPPHAGQLSEVFFVALTVAINLKTAVDHQFFG